MLQLAGHLQGQALQEWNLLLEEEKENYERAIQTLKTRLESENWVIAATDFRHTSQKDGESTSNFIRQLEQTFQVAYRRDRMSAETKDTLLHGRLQEGLHYELMRSPAVSGAQSDEELCLAAKNEEKRDYLN